MRKKDRETIRTLAHAVAEIAALPIQETTRNRWRALNGLKPQRPMVMIDQVCWNEMNIDDELTLQCQDKELRAWEQTLRRTLYQWKHFRADMVVDDFVRVEKAVSPLDFGMRVQEHTVETDHTNDVVSHAFTNQFQTADDLEKIKMPVITHDEAETARRTALAEELFDGILAVKPDGVHPYTSVWDPISMWMGVENALYMMIDEPELMHALAKRIVDGYLSGLDQMEAQGLLCGHESWIHCTGAWNDELPGAGFDPHAPKTKNLWMFTQAQMFSTVSPAMFEEYEIQHSMPLYERFGLVYYGCCDPLDRKMKEVRRIPHLRKVSISPWADKTRGAQEIAGDFVFSAKPNPAYLAAESFDEDLVRRDLTETKKICEANGCPLELILKDISTVAYKPERLWRWAAIASEVAEG